MDDLQAVGVSQATRKRSLALLGGCQGSGKERNVGKGSRLLEDFFNEKFYYSRVWRTAAYSLFLRITTLKMNNAFFQICQQKIVRDRQAAS